MRPESEKAEVIARTRLGESPQAIMRATGTPETTLHRWKREWKELAAEQEGYILEDDVRLALQSGDMIRTAFEQIEQKQTHDKHLMSLNAIRGTAIDKLLKRQAPSTNVSTTVFIGPQNLAVRVDTEH